MWDLNTVWFEIVFRASSVFVFIFIVFRLWVKKHFGELVPFDLIILLIMSEAVQNAFIGDDKGIPASFISIATMLTFNVILNKLSFEFKRAEDLIEGLPQVLIKNGKLIKNFCQKKLLLKGN
jgi:uncharacterized membrane protein YcaP (DUF421 family)